MHFKKTTLPNGLRIITVPVKDNPAVMVMVAVETGSYYESKGENGLSHFLEHMCFKGTAKRSTANAIARELDSLGAQNNAFTSNEYTGYWAKVGKKHFHKVFEIISDLCLNPILSAKELEKERGVILQEISMYEDQPQKKVYYVLRKLLYGDTSFGRPILGPVENIKKFSRSNFVKYRSKHYIANKTMVIVSGDVNHKEVEQEVKKYFKDIPRGKKPSKPKLKEAQKEPEIKIYKKKTDQTHMIMAFRMFGSRDKRMPAATVLATVLGRGMSSRLFQKMREEMGACYYVRAYTDDYSEHGLFGISTGIEARRIEEVIRALIDECKKLRDHEITGEELTKAKEYIVGHLYMNLETTDALAEFYASEEVSLGRLETPQEFEKLIRKVTAKDVIQVAKHIFRNEKLNLAIVGNIARSSEIKKTLSLKW